MFLLLILISLPVMHLAIIPDGICPTSGSTCDTLVDNSKVLQDILEVQGCCTHPDCPAVPIMGSASKKWQALCSLASNREMLASQRKFASWRNFWLWAASQLRSVATYRAGVKLLPCWCMCQF